MSKEEVKAKYAWLDPIASDIARSQSKSGSWGARVSRQTIASEKAKSQGYDVAWREQIAIENNPVNIARWKKEAQLIIDIEEKRLSDIRKEEREYSIFISGMAEGKRLQEIKDQEITFNEQTNSGDFNETPITDVNVNSGCSECTGTELRYDPIKVSSMPPSYSSQGYHKMPDGSLMKDSDMEKKPLNNNMKFVGIAAAGVIGLLLYSKGGLK